VSGVLAALLSGGGAPGVINGAIPGGSDTPEATLVITNDGTFTTSGGSGNWVTPASTTVAAFYQVKVDETSNAFTSGTVGTWLDCSSSRTWVEDAGSVTCTISFREKTTGIVRSVQTGVTFTAVP
jgi:hypothetical protein